MPVFNDIEPFIFISYAHRDIQQIQQHIDAITAAGYRVWYDKNIMPGSDWSDEIAQAIIDATVVLAFISSSMNEVRHVKDEINFALYNKKKIIAVYLEPTDLPLGLQMQLGSMKAIYLNGFSDQEKFYERLYSYFPTNTKVGSL